MIVLIIKDKSWKSSLHVKFIFCIIMNAKYTTFVILNGFYFIKMEFLEWKKRKIQLSFPLISKTNKKTPNQLTKKPLMT